MPRETDTSTIPTGFRTFIKTNEWENGEERQFYFTGYEKGEKLSKAGNKYIQYLIYLLPILPAGGIGEELTLGVFPIQAGNLKTAGIENYQWVNITKIVTEVDGKEYPQEDYAIVGVKEFLKEKDRPAPTDYPEMRVADLSTPTQSSRPAAEPEEEINIEDIPF